MRRLIDVVNFVVDEYSSIAEDVARNIQRTVWTATQYLSGSSLNDTPYEVIYSLGKALEDWTEKQSVITTALLPDQGYHCRYLDPSAAIRAVADPNFDVELIHIALPELYRHRPLYNVALYHELGHFIDQRFQVVGRSVLLQPVTSQPEIIHRMEYFSDLVAASYTGRSGIYLLQHIAPGAPVSPTHPATDDRIRNIEDFVTGKSNPTIDLFQKTLRVRKLPALEIRHKVPDIKVAFDNLNPYVIKDQQELHGLLEAGWEYLMAALTQSELPWSQLDGFNTARIINDLVEKSIRNWMIKEKWKNGTAEQGAVA